MGAVRLFAVADYMDGMAALIRHGTPGGFAAAVAGRAALEALAFTCWLVDPTISWEQRVARMVHEALHDQRSRHRVVSYARAEGVEPLLEPDGIAETCEAYGVAYEWGPVDKETGIRFPQLTGVKRPGAAQILTDHAASEEQRFTASALYYGLSDIAHASLQGLAGGARLSTNAGGRMAIAIDPLAVEMRVIAVLWRVPTPVLNVAGYFGFDPEPFQVAFQEATTPLRALLDAPD